MNIVFKLADGVAVDAANVGNSNFKDHYPEVNRSMAWKELLPYIEQATDTYVIPYIGQQQYDDIVNAYQADTLSGTHKLRFLELMQRAVAYYTVLHAGPKKLGVIASMGTVTNSPVGGSIPQSQWSHFTQMFSITKDADTFMDQCLQFLQDRVNASDADFDLWKDSAAFTEGKSDYFRSFKDFQVFHSINNSHRTFLSIVPYIQKATTKYILPIIGQTQHDLLVAAIKNGNATTAQQSLIRKIRYCLAEWSLFMAIPALTVVIEGDGIKVISSTDGMNTRGNVSSAFFKEAAQAHQYACEENGKTFRADLIEFLFKNEADYPDWVTSDFYTNATTYCDDTPIGGGKSVFL